MTINMRRIRDVYGASAGMVPKQYLAYGAWVWTEFILQITSMVIFVYFWRAVYGGTSTIGGLDLGQTLNYILLAQVFVPIVQNRLIFAFGLNIRTGDLAVDLIRPFDYQGWWYAQEIASLALRIVLKLPLVLLAVVLFGLQLPTSPMTYLVFLVSLLLGHAVLFCFDWVFACLAFYSTETWGLSVVREGAALFFSGALVPLAIMPDWLRSIANALPFAQALYVPVSILSGIESLDNAPALLGIQVAWLVGLLIVSRLIFRSAVRVVTVQGG